MVPMTDRFPVCEQLAQMTAIGTLAHAHPPAVTTLRTLDVRVTLGSATRTALVIPWPNMCSLPRALARCSFEAVPSNVTVSPSIVCPICGTLIVLVLRKCELSMKLAFRLLTAVSTWCMLSSRRRLLELHAMKHLILGTACVNLTLARSVVFRFTPTGRPTRQVFAVLTLRVEPLES